MLMLPYSLLQPSNLAYFSLQPGKQTPPCNPTVKTHGLFFEGIQWCVLDRITEEGATLQEAVSKVQKRIDKLVQAKQSEGYTSFKLYPILLGDNNKLTVRVQGAKVPGPDDTTLSGKRATQSGEGKKGKQGIVLP